MSCPAALQLLRGSFPASAIKSYPDVFYVEYFAATEDAPGGDLFFFDYGVVACWWVLYATFLLLLLNHVAVTVTGLHTWIQLAST